MCAALAAFRPDRFRDGLAHIQAKIVGERAAQRRGPSRGQTAQAELCVTQLKDAILARRGPFRISRKQAGARPHGLIEAKTRRRQTGWPGTPVVPFSLAILKITPIGNRKSFEKLLSVSPSDVGRRGRLDRPVRL